MKSLYKNLINLINTNDSFYFKDFIKDDTIYRIFNYRLASYTEFQIPGAIECRGIMFEIANDGTYIDIKSRPMSKFWNLHELEGHSSVDLSNVIRIMDKADI
jgi:T4 RnlA family RNA ligase